jgi:drug/metabolite transporter (DMT)-like permease
MAAGDLLLVDQTSPSDFSGFGCGPHRPSSWITRTAAGLIGGDPLSLPVVAGLLLALIGGDASAWTPPGARRAGGRPWQSAATCVAAAAAIAVMLIALHASGRADPYWATTTEHLSTAASAATAALAGSRGRLRGRLPAGQLPKLAVVALGGAGGDLAYAVASGGALSIVPAVSSLYPLATIALGVALQGQRPTRVQLAGITAVAA